MILLLFLASTTFHSSFVRALKMWRAENEAQRANATPPVVVGRENQEAQCQSASGSQDAQDVEHDDTPYTHTSFFSDNAEKSLTRRRSLSNLPLPAANVALPANPQRSQWERYGVWGKFIVVWLCMILVVAMRGGSGHSIVSIRSCSWEPLGYRPRPRGRQAPPGTARYWLVTSLGFLGLITVGALTRQPEAPWYLCLAVGAVSAVVGIGGAIVLNPMMVKRGIEVQVATATASLMVLAPRAYSLEFMSR